MSLSFLDIMQSPLLKAVKNDDVITVSQILTAESINETEKRFALVHAADQGCFEIVQMIIISGINVNQTLLFMEGNALRQAARSGHALVVKLLLEAGASTNILPHPKEPTTLILAIQEGHLNVVKILIEEAQANVNELSPSGDYPLLTAAINGYEEIFNYLMPLTNAELHQEALNELSNGIKRRWREENANPLINELTDNIWNDDFEAAIDMLQVGLDVSDFDEDGRTALFLAILKGSVSLVQFLIEAGANPDKGLEVERTTPLMVVPRWRWKQESIIILCLLLEAGADANARDLEEGWTPLMYFINSPAYSETEKVIRRQAIKLLLQRGVDINVKDNLGRTALDLAKDEHKGDLELVDLIENARQDWIG